MINPKPAKRQTISDISSEIIAGDIPLQIKMIVPQVFKIQDKNNLENPAEPKTQQKPTNQAKDSECHFTTENQMFQQPLNQFVIVENDSRAKRCPMNESIYQLNQFPEAPRNLPLPQQSSKSVRHRAQNQCLKSIKQYKWYIIVTYFLINLIVIAALSIAVGMDNRNQNEKGQELIINEVFTCEKYSSACSGVSQQVKKYVLDNFPNTRQAQSVLQSAKSLVFILNTAGDISYPSISIYRNLASSVECMSYALQNNYIEAYHNLSRIILSTSNNLQIYFNLLEAFSGQPLKFSSNQEVSRTCKFSLISTKAALRSSDSRETPKTNATCNVYSTSLLVYFTGIGYSPAITVSNAQALRNMTLTNTNAAFDADIVSLGMLRKTAQLGFIKNLTSSYSTYLATNGKSTLSPANISAMLLMILHNCKSIKHLPDGVSAQSFKEFLNFYVLQSAQSLLVNESHYEIANHKDFIRQQIAQGKKVTLLAHAEAALYVNKVYGLLNATEKVYVSLVYLAPISNNMADNSTNYITNPNDRIIQAIKNQSLVNGSIPNPLPANQIAQNFGSESEIETSHDLSGYLKYYRDKIIQRIISAKKAATQPTKLLKSGSLTVIVTWQNEPYIYLNVIEPSGRNVTSSSPKGTYGELDGDYVQPTWGIQHYSTNCSLGVGQYRVQLYLSSSSYSSKVLLGVSAGNQYWTQSVTLTPRQKKYVCSVIVDYQSGTNISKFTIVPY